MPLDILEDMALLSDKEQYYKELGYNMLSNVFCFSPTLLKFTNVKQLTVGYLYDGKKIEITRHAYNNVVELDVSRIISSFFDRREMKPNNETNNTTFKKIDYYFSFIYKDGNESRKYNFPNRINAFYGALQIGESYSQKRKYTCFKNLPFTVPIYLGREKFENTKNIYIHTENTELLTKNLAIGKYEYPLDTNTNASIFRISDNSAVFDHTFDESFRGTAKIDIEVRMEDCNDGVYLRWINRYGDWEYYLLKQANESSAVSNESVTIEEHITTTNFVDGFHVGTDHPIGKKVQKSIALFAPLVDENTFEQLQGLVQSPIVDMYCGNNNWLRVNMAAGTFARTNAPLQDFNCTLLLPKTFTQQL